MIALIAAGLLAALGLVAAFFATYQLVLAIAALPPRARRARGEASSPRTRLLVLVPAHDEAALIARCLRSLQQQSYPEELYRLVVIADNCTDDTAAIAERSGAVVLVRDVPDARGKGHALRWATDRLLAEDSWGDAIVVVDADSVAQREFLSELARVFEQGARVVQGESLIYPNESPSSALRATAFLLVNRVRPVGRAALGAPCMLAGNGMLFGREVLAELPWNAFSTTEDVEYTIQLRLRGISPVFASGATLYSPAAAAPRAAKEQELRWEGGKLHLARKRTGTLLKAAVRKRRLALLDTALELVVPPLGTLAGIIVLGAGLSLALAAFDLLPMWTAWPWLVALVALPLYVLIGMVAARAPRWAYRSLLSSPLFVLRKAVRMPGYVTFSSDTWVPTERLPEDADTGSTELSSPVERR